MELLESTPRGGSKPSLFVHMGGRRKKETKRKRKKIALCPTKGRSRDALLIKIEVGFSSPVQLKPWGNDLPKVIWQWKAIRALSLQHAWHRVRRVWKNGWCRPHNRSGSRALLNCVQTQVDRAWWTSGFAQNYTIQFTNSAGIIAWLPRQGSLAAPASMYPAH